MKTLWLSLATLSFMTLASCGEHKKPSGWRFSDEVPVAVDETFHDIIDEEIKTFSLLHPEAEPKPLYCSEDSAIKLLVKDSVRCCIVTRQLTEQEKQAVEVNRLGVKQSLIAADAFALIVNKANTDTLISVPEIRDIVSGKITRWEQLEHATRKGELKLVFDHSGSSTVRYMRDSLLAGQQVSGNLYAQGNNAAVIDLVKQDPEVIGVIGADWLRGKSDSALNSFENLDIKVLKVSRKSGPEEVGWRPYQYRIYTGDYPLVRSVYIISTDPRRNSQTTIFFHFLKGDQGQRVICNGSQLLPRTAVQDRTVTTK